MIALQMRYIYYNPTTFDTRDSLSYLSVSAGTLHCYFQSSHVDPSRFQNTHFTYPSPLEPHVLAPAPA
jgi:hypothetical protein